MAVGLHTLAIPESAAKLSPRELAQQSGATYVLDGDVLTAGGKTQITARLTDAGTGEGLWSDHYDFEGSDRLAMQSEAAREIYGVLGGGSYGKPGNTRARPTRPKANRGG
jgi:TolB-like protein